MWGVIVLVSAVVGALCFLVACVWLIRLYLIAPPGYQDGEGFHLGDPPQGSDSYPEGLSDHLRISQRFRRPGKPRNAQGTGQPDTGASTDQDRTGA